MPRKPPVSVVVPWSNRRAIGEALGGNAAWLRSTGAQLLIVNCSGDRAALASSIPEGLPGSAKIVHIAAKAFNKSLALNLGAFHARSDVLLFLDADVVLSV